MRMDEAVREAKRLRRLKIDGSPRFMFVTVDPTGAVFPDGDQEAVIRVMGNPYVNPEESGSIWTTGHTIECQCVTCQKGPADVRTS